MHIQRIAQPVAHPVADGNIRPLYPIQRVPWLWHPDCPHAEPAALIFRNEFETAAPRDIVIHVSADQRWELSLDGEIFSMGPDRSDIEHWSFHSYRLRLAPGRHALEALVWWIGDHAPVAQTTRGGGFALTAENADGLPLDTGSGAWRVRRVKGWSFIPALYPHFVGATHVLDGSLLFAGSELFVVPKTVSGPVQASDYGLMRIGRRLYPSALPEQLRRIVRCGRVRAVVPDGLPLDRPIRPGEINHPATPEWQKLVDGRAPIAVPANTVVSILVDLDDYYCAYPDVTLSGGAGAEVTVSWAESLYEADAAGKRARHKGDRNEVAGKVFLGTADIFRADGGEQRRFRPCWWRAGRYMLLTIRTAAEPLRLDDFHLLECRYPLENEGRFASSRPELDAAIPVLMRGMQMCAHETYMDCPYYEQLMYVGDTRLEMLTTYVMTADDRLPTRGIELFDWSRRHWELVAEHYPSRTPQLSPTFSLIWVSMVRDFAFWRDRPETVRALLPGVRGVLEQFRAMRGPGGLLERLPGWPFVDWVPGWKTGNAPTGDDELSSIVNLFFVQALHDAADVEDSVDEPAMAERNRALARELSERIVALFWTPGRNLLADETRRILFSEHAQCLALLNDVLAPAAARACFETLIREPDLSRATVYFSFYLLEVLRRFRRGDLILKKLEFWRDMVAQGLKTPIEAPEPSRSDCHAWGSHPLFHMHASLCGIRPISAGFRRVEVAPLPGDLSHLECSLPHPRGRIEVELDFDPQSGTCRGRVALPPDTPGVFRWQDRDTPLLPNRETRVG